MYIPYLHDDEWKQKQNNAFLFTILSKQTLSQKKNVQAIHFIQFMSKDKIFSSSTELPRTVRDGRHKQV